MRPLKFGNLRLKNRLGVSSENVIYTDKFYKWIINNYKPSIVFSPTFSKVDPLEEQGRIYARVAVAQLSVDGYLFYLRPLSIKRHNVKKVIDFRDDTITLIASIYGRNLLEWEELIEFSEREGFDGLEMDLSLEPLLGEKYMISNLVSEVRSMTKLPFFVKLPVSAVSKNQELIHLISNIDGLVLTPRLVYSVGHHLLRACSTDLSKLALGLLMSIAKELKNTIDVAFISDLPPRDIEPLIDELNLILYDMVFLLEYLGIRGKISINIREPMLRWPSIPRNMKLTILSDKLPLCRVVCPNGSIPETPLEEEELVEVDESCDFCGLCLYLCRNNMRFTRIFKP